MYLDHFFAHHIHLKNDVKDDFTHRFSELHTTKEEKKAMRKSSQSTTNKNNRNQSALDNI
jgi:hypothetical protein